MRQTTLARLSAAVLALGAATASAAQTTASTRYDTIRARPFDTGRMWTFDFPPVDYIERTYGFRPTEQWLDNVRLSSLRFATWCSASFVSPEGLVLTNHHCAVPTLDPVQREGENLLTNGFISSSRGEERRVMMGENQPLFVEQLLTIEDVTERMTAALEEGGLERQAAVREELERPDAANRMRYQVVEFYNGGRYSRYGYRRYDDVRLVFAPEQQIAFYGGDPDNFNFPRYALDFALFRVYENGEPLRPQNYLRWSRNGAQNGDAVFVVGNPGATQRQYTNAQLEYLRDVQQPAQLAVLRAQRAALLRLRDADSLRWLDVRDNFFSLENSIKVIQGRREGALDPALWARKVDWERAFRAAVAANPALQARAAAAWDSIAAYQAEKRVLAPGLLYNAYLNSGPLGRAVALARAAAGENQYRNSATAPETRSEQEQIIELTELLRVAHASVPGDTLLQMVLNGRTPEQAAEQIVRGWTLDDAAARRALLEGGAAAVQASSDPVLAVARRVAPILSARQRAMAAITARETVQRGVLGRAFFEVYGTDVPPDATFTLRLADGVVKGFEAAGMMHPWTTTFYGLYNRAIGFGDRGDFALPPRWKEPAPGLDLETPYNFVSTNDIIGGNSGSPMINRDSEVVGLIFDGNLYSLPGNFIFDETQNRTISVHSSAIVEVLRDVYGVPHLVTELLAPTR